MSFVRRLPWFALHGALLGCASPAAPPAPPGGGPALHLDYASFASAVEPILIAHGCDAEGDCHGGGIRGTLQLSPPTAKDAHYDFAQVSLQVTANFPDQSPILTRPLALGAGRVAPVRAARALAAPGAAPALRHGGLRHGDGGAGPFAQREARHQERAVGRSGHGALHS